MTTKIVESPIQLRWGEKNKRVVVTPEDEDRFIVTVEAAIHACNADVKLSAFMSVFNNLLARLAEWIRQHDEQVRDAYLTVRDAGLRFVVVMKTRDFDREFEDSLSDLDIEIANDKDFEMIRLSALELPNASEEAISAFLTPQNTLKYKKDA